MQSKKIYFAPMEGVTKYVLRNAHHKYYGGVDLYFTPFITASQKIGMKERERKDILPSNNANTPILPQILAGRAEDFLTVAESLAAAGYDRVNFNMGCPAKTVVTKGKGAGMLRDPSYLDSFFAEIFEKSPLKLSVKTRIGLEEPGEFLKIIPVINKYPFEEVIIHPRLQKDKYEDSPNREAFAQAISLLKKPVCYNGDIFSGEELARFYEDFPGVSHIMIGRGFLKNPALTAGIKEPAVYKDKERLYDYVREIQAGYEKIMSGQKPVLFHMKEFWFYLIDSFAEGKAYQKKLKKAETLSQYNAVIDQLFRNSDINFC